MTTLNTIDVLFICKKMKSIRKKNYTATNNCTKCKLSNYWSTE